MRGYLGLLCVLAASAGAVAFDPIPSLGGKDLACSACTLVARGIEDGLVKIAAKKQRKKKKKRKVASLLKTYMVGYCKELKNMAVIGEDGSREYVDLAMALGQDTRGRKKTNLNNVKMGPDVAIGLKDSCVYFSGTYADTVDIEKTTKTVRTMKELDVFTNLCVDSTAVCTPKKAATKTSKKGLKNKSKKRKYMESRPFLVGRAKVGGEERFCETCAIIVEEVHLALVKEVDRVRHTVTAGKEEKHDFDVPKIVSKLCNVNLNRAFKDLSTAVQQMCAEVSMQQQNALAPWLGLIPTLRWCTLFQGLGEREARGSIRPPFQWRYPHGTDGVRTEGCDLRCTSRRV
jgi:hypothetical protein